MKNIFEVGESDKYGVFLKVNNLDYADEFDDYISKDIYVLSNMANHDSYNIFYFGKAASLQKVYEIARIFLEKFHPECCQGGESVSIKVESPR